MIKYYFTFLTLLLMNILQGSAGQEIKDVELPSTSEESGDIVGVEKITSSVTTTHNLDTTYAIPLAGNAFVTTTPTGSQATITTNGLVNWSNSNGVSSVYFRTKGSGKISISLRAKTSLSSDSSVVKVTVNGSAKNVAINGSTNQDYYVGTLSADTGYQQIDLQGISKTGEYFADISHVIVEGEATSAGLLYSNDPAYYYWSRRGPSCHLKYSIPTSSNTSYYYSEIMVPEGSDNVGSYYMANGFGQGYFGFQVNSDSERRVLFSVWSPYSTDNPNDIPDDYKIILNKKGTDVQTGEFGNEGSGGQSYLRYNWKAGNTYKFLLKGEPDGNGKTDYTAWFYAPEQGEWKLIASFKRPHTSTYLTGFHSFLENFNDKNGYMERDATYQNQWVCTSTGTWHKVNSAVFTVDATYEAKQRIDAIGGTNTDGYFLRNGGFFNEVVPPNTKFDYNNMRGAPAIDFSSLP